ncbi:MAG: hypothetical protein AAF456_13035, partial [Planctomycetota bacterium]
MPLKKTSVLLGCHSLEDFPVHLNGADADSILASWTVAWHPGLIAQTGQIPGWNRADSPPEEVKDTLLLVPIPSSSQIPSGYLRRAQRDGATVLTGQIDRRSAMQALSESGLIDVSSWEDQPETEQTFFALGYAFLQIQLLTRQLRGSSNLQEENFRTLLVEAATLYQQKMPQAREKLGACFDLLMQEKNCYYPVQGKFIDLILTAESV